MKKQIALTILALFAFCMLMAHARQITGTAQLTVTQQSSGSLLPGAVVTSDAPNGANSTISVPIPPGWTLYWARGFENGFGVGGPEQNNNSNGGGITNAQFHTGGHSFSGLYNSNGNSVSYNLCGSIYTTSGNSCGASAGLGSFSEMDVSFWDRVDINGYYSNSDYFWGGLAKQNVCGQVQDIQLDAQFGGAVSSLSSSMVVIGEGSTDQSAWPACQGYYQYSNTYRLAMNQGRWRHIEYHIIPSTTVSSPFSCTQINNSGSDCVGNGYIDVWVDEALAIHIPNADLNGTTSMAGADVGVGGVITSCTAAGCDPGCAPFSACPGPVPGSGAPPPFNRYIDDVAIIVKR